MSKVKPNNPATIPKIKGRLVVNTSPRVVVNPANTALVEAEVIETNPPNTNK